MLMRGRKMAPPVSRPLNARAGGIHVDARAENGAAGEQALERRLLRFDALAHIKHLLHYIIADHEHDNTIVVKKVRLRSFDYR